VLTGLKHGAPTGAALFCASEVQELIAPVDLDPATPYCKLVQVHMRTERGSQVGSTGFTHYLGACDFTLPCGQGKLMLQQAPATRSFELLVLQISAAELLPGVCGQL